MEKIMLPTWIAALARAVLLAGLLGASLAHAQKGFTTPESAAEALVKALRDNDSRLLEVVLGKEWKRFVPTDDLSRDDVAAFLAGWDKQHRIEHESDGIALLTVGGEPGFSLPIPIARNKRRHRKTAHRAHRAQRTRGDTGGAGLLRRTAGIRDQGSHR
jgi:hypothetical protein